MLHLRSFRGASIFSVLFVFVFFSMMQNSMIHNSGNLEPISLQSESVSGLVNNKLVTKNTLNIFIQPLNIHFFDCSI